MNKRDDYKISGGFSSNIGNVRSVNQDAIFFRNERKHGISLALGAVCDGIGGLDHGEIASSMIVQGMNEWFDRIINELDLRKTEPDILNSHLLDAAETWNYQIHTYQNQTGIKTGSTMSAILFFQGVYNIIQVGDSRIYLYDNGLKQLTSDETNYHIRDGKMKGYLSNFMGKDESLSYTSYSGEIKKETFFLCCSDGFYHHLVDDDIAEVFGRRGAKADFEGESSMLVRRMMERGERDNISLGIMYLY